MKVNSTNLNSVLNTYNKQKNLTTVGQTAKVKKDEIVLSDSAKYLSKIKEEKMDMEKINEIKSQIKGGKYNYSSEDIAKKILESMKGMK